VAEATVTREAIHRIPIGNEHVEVWKGAEGGTEGQGLDAAKATPRYGLSKGGAQRGLGEGIH
jgi:hypothetical protein